MVSMGHEMWHKVLERIKILCSGVGEAVRAGAGRIWAWGGTRGGVPSPSLPWRQQEFGCEVFAMVALNVRRSAW
jgi:hypothetical protein